MRVSLENLRTFPWIAAKEADGRLALVGARFSIADGILNLMAPDGDFRPA